MRIALSERVAIDVATAQSQASRFSLDVQVWLVSASRIMARSICPNCKFNLEPAASALPKLDAYLEMYIPLRDVGTCPWSQP